MNRPFASPQHSGRFGVSLAEALVVVIIAAGIFLFLQLIFSSGIQQTIRGTSLLNTIKETGDLFSALRRDLLQANQVLTVDDADLPQSVTLSTAGEALPAAETMGYPSAIVFSHPDNATVSYLISPMPDHKKAIVRTRKQRGTIERKFFAIPKIQVFRALTVLQQHELQGSEMFTRHLFVEIELQSQEANQSRRPVRLSSFLSPSNLNLSRWNYFLKIPETP